jgi:hypothetical protein
MKHIDEQTQDKFWQTWDCFAEVFTCAGYKIFNPDDWGNFVDNFGFCGFVIFIIDIVCSFVGFIMIFGWANSFTLSFISSLLILFLFNGLAKLTLKIKKSRKRYKSKQKPK